MTDKAPLLHRILEAFKLMRIRGHYHNGLSLELTEADETSLEVDGSTVYVVRIGGQPRLAVRGYEISPSDRSTVICNCRLHRGLVHLDLDGIVPTTDWRSRQ